MVRHKGRRMEAYFGLFGAIFLIIVLPLTAFLTPGYNPLVQMISNLGYGRAKSLFSIGFVVTGSLLIPFYIYLERELINIKEVVRRLATGIAIVTNVGIALVGIIPDETIIDAFRIFHSIVAAVSFAGSSVYIVLYSVLMYQGPKSKLYRGPDFKRVLAFFGFLLGILMVIYLFAQFPLFEWILTMLMLIWVLIAAIQSISFKFFNIPGMYYKRSQFPEALELFENAFQVLDNLGMSHDPIAETLQKNIEFIKTEIDKKSIK
ncbi:MAG: DUF998 domain-containing protein [Candidatus Hodarchaeota archaeon]